MTQRRPGRRRPPLPSAFLGALGLVILAESWFAGHELDLAMKETLGVSHAARSARDPKRDASVLAMGDSLVKHGIVPRVIEDRTGRKTRNIAISGGYPPLTYLLFEQALAHGRKPDVVVVDFKPSQLQGDPKLIFLGLASESTLLQWVDLARTCREPALLGQLAANGLLPSLRHRWRVGQAVTEALSGRPLDVRDQNLASLRGWDENLGAETLGKNPGYATAAGHWDDKAYLPDFGWYCHPINAEYLQRFLRRAEAEGIAVVWVAPPINPRIQAARDVRGLDAGFTKMLRNSVRRHPGLTVLDARHSGYPGDVFHDGAHLDLDGAAAFSGQVAEALRSLLDRPAGSPRWVDLAAYQPAGSAPAGGPIVRAPSVTPALRR